MCCKWSMEYTDGKPGPHCPRDGYPRLLSSPYPPTTRPGPTPCIAEHQTVRFITWPAISGKAHQVDQRVTVAEVPVSPRECQSKHTIDRVNQQPVVATTKQS